MKKAIIVLGMHRSGTSALTRVLNLCGVPLAADLIPPRLNDNETGFWESSSIVEIHEELLASAGSSYDDFLEFPQSWFGSPVAARFKQRILVALEDCFASEPLFLLKDPRICRLVPFWLDVLADFGAEPNFVFITRNPLEIAASLQRRNEFDPYKSLLLWLQHFLPAERDTRNQPRTFITYDQLMQDWRGVVARLARELQVNFPGSLVPVSAEIEAFLRPDLWHHQEKVATLSERDDIASWIAGAFDWAIAASEGRVVSPEPLDAISEAVREAGKAYGPIVAKAESQQVIDLKTKVRSLTGEIEWLYQEVQSRDRQISSLMTHEVQARELQISRLNNELQSRDRQVNQLNQSIQDHKQEIHHLNQGIQDREQEIHNLNQGIQDREQEIHNLNQGIQDREQEIHHLNQNLNQINQQIQDREQKIQELKRGTQDRDRQVKKITKKVKVYQAHLAAIENSKAWKLVTAIRKLSRPAKFFKPEPESELPAQLEIVSKPAEFAKPEPEPEPEPEPPAPPQIVSKPAELSDLERNQPPIACHLAIDLAIAVSKIGIFLQGWLVDSEAPVKALRLETNGEIGVQFKHLLRQYSRPDVYQEFKAKGMKLADDCLGFSCLVPIPIDPENPPYVTIIAEFLAGGDRKFSFPITQPTANPLPLIQQILNYVDSHSSRVEKYLDECIAPTVSILWQGRQVSARVQEVVEYGKQANQPTVSVIVPLYGRIDFVKIQLSLFADDPDFQENELIYILDDPRLSEELQSLSSQVFALFKVPFKVIYTGKNLGYAGANNLAVTQAKGNYLILLNSDVMPKQNGWITDLKTAYQSLPKVGAIAPKLLFEDESIQHAGIIPYRLPTYRYLWFNSHPGKGLPSSLMSERNPTQMPAVTGACMMVERELYLQNGGLSEDYILGDFEDSDFCFKLNQLGLQNYYIPTIEMYHLERQSQILIGESQWRQSLTLYNAWVHTKRWDSLIQEMLVSELKIKNNNE